MTSSPRWVDRLATGIGVIVGVVLIVTGVAVVVAVGVMIVRATL